MPKVPIRTTGHSGKLIFISVFTSVYNIFLHLWRRCASIVNSLLVLWLRSPYTIILVVSSSFMFWRASTFPFTRHQNLNLHYMVSIGLSSMLHLALLPSRPSCFVSRSSVHSLLVWGICFFHAPSFLPFFCLHVLISNLAPASVGSFDPKKTSLSTTGGCCGK